MALIGSELTQLPKKETIILYIMNKQSLVCRFLYSTALFTSLSLSCQLHPATAGGIYTANPFPILDPRGQSPHTNWKQIDTPKFTLIYPAPLHSLAVRSTQIFEEVHQLLSPLLDWQPRSKVKVLLLDNRDQANGLTAPILGVGITLWAVPPSTQSTTYFYDDWLRMLIIHEYAHFLNMDATDGILNSLRTIFGDLPLLNSLLPPWFLEGLAVYFETELTTAGRGRSTYYEMVHRAAVQEGVFDHPEFVNLDKINGSNPYFPRGDIRYLFGYQWVNELAKQRVQNATSPSGVGALGAFSRQSARSVPYLHSGVSEGVVGKSFETLWSEWVASTRTRVTDEISRIKSRPLTPFTHLIPPSHSESSTVFGSALSPDGGSLAINYRSTAERSGLFIIDVKTQKMTKLADRADGVGIAFTPDSNYVLFSQITQEDNYNTYSELYSCQIETGHCQQLTHYLRAADPDVSLAGDQVVFTVYEEGRTKLYSAALFLSKTAPNDGVWLGAPRLLHDPGDLEQISNPKFSIDGKKITFVSHPLGKRQSDLLAIDLEKRTVSTLVADGSFNTFPAIDNQGRLYFISDRTGVSNLYLFRESKPQLVSNVITGLAAPTFQRVLHSFSRANPFALAEKKFPIEYSDYYASLFTTSGWALSKLSLDTGPGSKLEEKDVAITLPSPAPLLEKPRASPTPSSALLEPEMSVHNYNPLPSLIPRFWSPTLSLDSALFSAGAQTAGFDDLYIHRYLVGTAYTPKLGVGEGSLLYSTQLLGPEIRLGSDYLTVGTSQSGKNLFSTHFFDVTATLSYPISWTYSSLTAAIGLNAQKYFIRQYDTDYSNPRLNQMTDLVPIVDFTLSYTDLENSDLSVTDGEKGVLTRLGVRSYSLPNMQTQWKSYLGVATVHRLGNHVTLRPSLKGQWASLLNQDFLYASGILSGRTNSFMSPVPSDNLNQIGLRGYAGLASFNRLVGVGSLDLRFPIVAIFRGFGLIPAFFNQLSGLAFLETAALPSASGTLFLPATGFGVRLTNEFFYNLRSSLALELHYGFDRAYGGGTDLILQLSLGGLGF